MSTISTKTAVVYRNRLEVWADKYLFMLLFFAGCTAIIFMKQLGLGQVAVTTVPVCAMLLYGAYVLFTPRYRVRSDRAGDSLYYLGFLYTMVSLAYSLYEFRGEDTSTQKIVTNFGIALATTIVGLMLRVVYHQLREDPFDVEQEARVELSQAASLLHGVLLHTVSDFDALRLAVSQVVTEATDDAKKRINVIASEIEAATQAQTEFLTKFSEEASKELRQHHSEMLQASRSMTAAVKRIADRIEAVDVPADTIKARIDRIEIPQGLIKDRIDGIEIPPDIIRHRLEAVNIPADIFTSRFNSILHQLETIIAGFGERAGREAAVMQNLEALIRAAAEAAERMRMAASNVREDDETRRKRLQEGLEAFTTIVNSLNSTARAISQQSSASLEHNTKLLSELVASSASAVQAVEEHRSRLDSQIRSSDMAVSQVHGSLVSLTKTVVEKINGRA